jgi:hypothetical protein
MKKLLISTALILLSAISVFSQTCEWAGRIGGSDLDFTFSSTVDVFGNIFVSGYFYSDTLSFNSGNLFNYSGKSDIFLAKYNSNGNCEWFQKIAGSDDDVARYIITDVGGNVYVAGEFISDTLFFNNGILLTNNSNTDAFIAKYNKNGACQWAEKIAGNLDDYNFGIALDANSNVYVAGHYNSDTLNFNNSKSLNNNGIYDGFIAKYNKNGVCQWAEKIAGNDNDEAYSITIDSIGNIFVAGYYYSDTLYFNNEKFLTNNGNTNIFLAKYNESGICQWTEKISDCGGFGYNITIEVNDYIYVTGCYKSNKMEFNNNISLSSFSGVGSDAFIAQYNENGICQWAEKISGHIAAFAYDLAVDRKKNVYVVGYYDSPSLNFNNGITLSNSNRSDSYFAKYNSNGICQWAEKISGSDIDDAYSIAVDSSDNIYLTGNFSSPTIMFNNNKLLDINDYYDVFIAKYSPILNSVSDNTVQNNISVCPNPAGDYIEIQPSEGSDIQIFDMLGVLVAQTSSSVIYRTVDYQNQTGTSDPLRIDVSFLSPGMYFIKIGNRVMQFVKM